MSSHGGRRRTTLTGALALTVLALLAPLTGCATAEPGQAAVVGDFKIPESTIAEQMRALNEAAGKPADEPNAELTVQMVNYNVAFELVRQAAAQLGVVVPQARSDEFYFQQAQQYGGEERMREIAAQQGISPLLLRANFDTQILVEQLLNRVAPGAGQEEQSLALQQILAGISDEVGVEVAPKYGAWDVEQLALAPLPDPVSRPRGEPSPQPSAVP